jgi:hypothetical protein
MDKKSKFSRGGMSLVLVGAASLSAGCGVKDHDVVQNMNRPLYASLEDCKADWGNEDRCEQSGPSTAAAAQGSSNSTHGGGTAATRVFFWGPYYTQSGTVYEFDGRRSSISQMPSRMVSNTQQSISPAGVYASGGRYVSTPPHSSASSAKSAGVSIARGGFGGGGHASAGG